MKRIYSVFLLVGLYAGLNFSNAADVADPSVVKIPKLAGVTIDGKFSDWTGYKALKVKLFANSNGIVPDSNDISANVYYGWNEIGFLVMVDVKDDTIYSGDNVEIFVGDKTDGKNLGQFIINVQSGDSISIVYWDYRGSRSVTSIPLKIDVKKITTAKGYQLEALIPWNTIGIAPKVGSDATTQVYVNDADHEKDASKQSLKWHHMNGTYMNPMAVVSAVLGESKSADVYDFVQAYLLDSNTYYVKVFSKASNANQIVSLKDGKNEIISSKLINKENYSMVVMTIPSKAVSNVFVPKSIFIGDRKIDQINFNIVDLKYETKKGPDFEYEIKLIKMADSKKMPAKGGIVFIGHSFMRFWKTLDDDMQETKVLNRSFGGSRIENLIYFFDNTLTPYAPGIVVFINGANDIGTGDSPENAFNEFKAWVEKLHTKLPKTKLIVVSHTTYHYTRFKSLKIFDDLVYDYVKNSGWIQYADIRNVLPENDEKALFETMHPDKIHFNSKGYSLITSPIKKEIIKALK
jgi:lysophospholipase L1-like esterase